MKKAPLAKIAAPFAMAMILAACGADPPAAIEPVEDDAGFTYPAPGQAAAIDSFYQPVLLRLDEDMQQFIRRGEATSLAYALIKGGDHVQAGFHGTRTPDSAEPVDEHTPYPIGGLTAPVTTVALLMLMEEGEFSLEDPVTRFLPELDRLQVTRTFETASGRGLRPANRPPTMRELLTHTAGFASGGGRTDYANRLFEEQDVEGASSNEDYLERLAAVPLMYQPGAAWSYSAASNLQGIIVERITGERLGVFMQRRIFEPLVMTETRFPAGVAEPRRDDGGEGLISTIADYERFVRMLASGGTLDGQTLLRADTVRLLATGATDFRDPETGLKIHEPFGGTSFGFGVAVVTNTIRSGLGAPEGSYFWESPSGSWFWVDPYHDIIFIGMAEALSAEPVMPRRTAMNDVYHALFTDYFPSTPVVPEIPVE